jgi:hypothetical protein
MANIRHDLQLYDRTPDYNIKHSREYNPSRYISIQSRVNDDPDYETEYFAKLISEGWFKLEDNRAILKDEVKGRHFKYRLNGNGLSNAEKGTFRSGGIIIGRKNMDDDYVLYKAYNGCLFPLQMNDVYEIYMKDPNIKIEGKKGKEQIIKGTVWFNEPENETRYPVFLKSKLTGNNIVVHYAPDNWKWKQFQTSKKYIYAVRTSNWGFK